MNFDHPRSGHYVRKARSARRKNNYENFFLEAI